MSSERCKLTLVVNGELVGLDDAAEVLGIVHEWACPDGELVADFALDRPTSARMVAAQIAYMLRPSRLALL